MRVYINIYNHSRFICLDLNSYIHTNRFIYLLILSFFLTFIIFKKKIESGRFLLPAYK